MTRTEWQDGRLSADLSEFNCIARQSSTIKSHVVNYISTDEITAILTVQFKVNLPATVLVHNVI